MKKLLCSAAVCGLALAANPAQAADGLKLDVGGYFTGYGMYTNQDDENIAGNESRQFDIIRNTEVHFGGETTLDNGLTVGVQIEANADEGDSFGVDESYAYFSGGWGRVNFGAEDGAAYLLQVEAPSADDNIDGIRQLVNPINYAAMETGGTLAGLNFENDYDQDISAKVDKLTYLSPVMNGFQVGMSYTPDLADASAENAGNQSEQEDSIGSVYEIGARYEGQFNNVGVIAGAGYTHGDVEQDNVVQAAGNITDDREAWNAGVDLDIGPFGVGVAYQHDNAGDVALTATTEQDAEQTWVVGVDYTTGPFKVGASYMNKDGAIGLAGATGSDGVESEKYAGGVVYTYGPGMTFRGSVSHVNLENVAGLTPATTTDADATSVVLGTQINF